MTRFFILSLDTSTKKICLFDSRASAESYFVSAGVSSADLRATTQVVHPRELRCQIQANGQANPPRLEFLKMKDFDSVFLLQMKRKIADLKNNGYSPLELKGTWARRGIQTFLGMIGCPTFLAGRNPALDEQREREIVSILNGTVPDVQLAQPAVGVAAQDHLPAAPQPNAARVTRVEVVTPVSMVPPNVPARPVLAPGSQPVTVHHGNADRNEEERANSNKHVLFKMVPLVFILVLGAVFVRYTPDGQFGRIAALTMRQCNVVVSQNKQELDRIVSESAACEHKLVVLSNKIHEGNDLRKIKQITAQSRAQVKLIKKLFTMLSVHVLLANERSTSIEHLQAKLVDTERHIEDNVRTVKDLSTCLLLSKSCGEETYHLQEKLVDAQQQIEERETKAENLQTRSETLVNKTEELQAKLMGADSWFVEKQRLIEHLNNTHSAALACTEGAKKFQANLVVAHEQMKEKDERITNLERYVFWVHTFILVVGLVAVFVHKKNTPEAALQAPVLSAQLAETIEEMRIRNIARRIEFEERMQYN